MLRRSDEHFLTHAIYTLPPRRWHTKLRHKEKCIDIARLSFYRDVKQHTHALAAQQSQHSCALMACTNNSEPDGRKSTPTSKYINFIGWVLTNRFRKLPKRYKLSSSIGLKCQMSEWWSVWITQLIAIWLGDIDNFVCHSKISALITTGVFYGWGGFFRRYLCSGYLSAIITLIVWLKEIVWGTARSFRVLK